MTKIQTDTSTALLEYIDNIMYVRVKAHADFTEESIREQFEAQKEMVGDDEYGVLVDGSKGASPNREARQIMADHEPPRRKATAIVINGNLAVLMVANFYMKVNKPVVPTQLFQTEPEAVAWLKKMLER